ncbi:hypothetical protein EVAR_77675_1 [Eumeta japonica]|uniref:Uncharacterized protein n=1 Tax=Eumeta variegata TaxID=151549 RepID=A0A4C2A9E6_EUMVA|nr:hypothetical protein EVAR_77675_1 [Eumeta japonica]
MQHERGTWRIQNKMRSRKENKVEAAKAANPAHHERESPGSAASRPRHQFPLLVPHAPEGTYHSPRERAAHPEFWRGRRRRTLYAFPLGEEALSDLTSASLGVSLLPLRLAALITF